MADTVDTSSWDGPAVMSDGAASDDPAAFYAAVCAGQRDGDPAVQSTWALPHHTAPDEPPNADGVRDCMSRLPQTDGLVNADEAQAHLDAHMAEVRDAMGMPSDLAALAAEGPLRTLDLPGEHVLSVDSAKRVIGLRVVRYNEVVEHPAYGRLMFEPGAFVPRPASEVRLRMDHADPPTGIGIDFHDSPTAPVMDFRVSQTQRGDEQLTLARDGVSRGTSPGFYDVPGKPQRRLVDGKPTTVYPPGSAVLAELSTTWSPTFAGDGVAYMLSRGQEGNGPVAENEVAPVAGAVTQGVDYERLAETIARASARAGSEAKMDSLLTKFDEMVELQRSSFTVPAASRPKPNFKDWFGVELRRLAGAHIPASELKALAIDDVVSSEQPGLIPAVFTADYDDVISQDRPFLRTTRQVRPPATGNTMMLPVITTRAAAGSQGGGEKTEVTTTAPKVGTGTFTAVSVLAGADISFQMILRADRSFLDLLDAEFAEAYALDEDSKAITALLAGYTDSAGVKHVVNSGGALDPEDFNPGAAWRNSIAATKRAPDHIWMSSVAVQKFIDAKDAVTNAPLYSNLAAAFTAGGGPGGMLSGLTPVYVPALDSLGGADAIIGPSRGFVWAEDPSIRLQADNPSVGGRDILLAGTLFAGPRYANAFTVYDIQS